MKSRSLFGAMIASLFLANAASAGQVWINSGHVVGVSHQSTVAHSKYRLSNSAFDMSIDNGAGTGVAGQYIAANLGAIAQLNNVTFNFVIEHIAGQGLIFRMGSQSESISETLSWGDFSNAPAGTSVTELGGESVGRSFNSLHIEARATAGNSTITFNDLMFTSALSVADGSFYDGSVSHTSGGSGEIAVQELFAGADLSTIDWTLTGQVMGFRTGVGGGLDEDIRFVVGQRMVEFTLSSVTAIPLPTPAALAAAGLLAIPALRRRRCS